jgi:DNA-binding transcriptional LysR family regulator
MTLSGHVPELSALQLLLTVGATGSLNAAARSCGISQQAASQRLTAIERQTGLSLVERGPRGTTLTADGRLLAHWSARVVEAADALDSGIAALRGGRAAGLRVAASLTVAEHLVPGWLIALGPETAGRIRLRTANSRDVFAALRAGEVDLGFVETTDIPSGIRTDVVGGDRLALVVGAGHPWATRSTAVPGRLLAETPTVGRERGSGTRRAYVAAVVRAFGADVEVAEQVLELDSATAIRAAAAAGVAPAVLSELAVADDVRTGRLVRLRVRDLDLRRRFHAAWVGAARPPAGLARQLVDVAVTTAARRP